MKVLNQINRKSISRIRNKQYSIALLMFCRFCYAQDNPSQVVGSSLADTISEKRSFAIEGVDLDYFRWKSDQNFRNDSIKIFSLSPISKRVNKVNGFTLGVGHYKIKT
ncbi:hypothetical protein [Flavobacterium sp.]|uniref:hypothetical protein n=1 Tax=Flavobacterium sp. TaxID=239 RepID=UPI003264E3C1